MLCEFFIHIYSSATFTQFASKTSTGKSNLQSAFYLPLSCLDYMLLHSKESQYHIRSNWKRFFLLSFVEKKKIQIVRLNGFMYRKNCNGLTFPETVFTLNQLVCKKPKEKKNK